VAIRLLSGSPDQAPASFSRFVLPFAYRLVECAIPDLMRAAGERANAVTGSWDNLARWVPALANPQCGLSRSMRATLQQRQSYFTAETSEVLFGSRTRRFRLECPASPICCSEVWANEERAFLEPPELILFECEVRGAEDNLLQVGLLVLSTHFDASELLSSTRLFKFNECFRNFRRPFDGYGAGPPNFSAVPWLPLLLTRGCDCSDDPNTPYQQHWLRLLDAPVVGLGTGNRPYQLFDADRSARARQFCGTLAGAPLSPMIHADHRTYVWTAAVCKGGACELTACADTSPVHTRGWMSLVNIDDPWDTSDQATLASKFDVQWLDDHSYLRWAPASLYGFTQHSGAAWLPAFAEPPLWNHFRSIYFDQTCLLLYLRSAIFGFSREVSSLSRQMQLDQRQGTREFSALERDFGLFTNLYQFPLLSHQQQAVEMYSKQRAALDIDDFYQEVKEEIQHMAEMFDRRHDRDIRSLGLIIAVIATLGVVWGDLGLGKLFDTQSSGVTGLAMVVLAALIFTAVKLFLCWIARRR